MKNWFLIVLIVNALSASGQKGKEVVITGSLQLPDEVASVYFTSKGK